MSGTGKRREKASMGESMSRPTSPDEDCYGKQLLSKDSLPEWSKGVDSSSTSASCVGSNPTAVILLFSSARHQKVSGILGRVPVTIANFFELPIERWLCAQ